VLARVDRAGDLEDAIGQRRLPMVDVGDDREVADVRGGCGHSPRSMEVDVTGAQYIAAMEPAAPLSEPTQRLAPAALSYWRVRGALWAGAFLVAAAMVASWNDLPGFLQPLVWIAAVAGGLVRAVVEPQLRWRRWRYEIRPEEIDIRHGVWSIERTLVPMARVQHVDTESGLLQQSFGLATVSFHTAAGEIEIPQLTEGEAAAVRDRIASLARVAGNDV
jgi:membrane protein YdbS with pleckstrin-like domain